MKGGTIYRDWEHWKRRVFSLVDEDTSKVLPEANLAMLTGSSNTGELNRRTPWSSEERVRPQVEWETSLTTSGLDEERL